MFVCRCEVAKKTYVLQLVVLITVIRYIHETMTILGLSFSLFLYIILLEYMTTRYITFTKIFYLGKDFIGIF